MSAILTGSLSDQKFDKTVKNSCESEQGRRIDSFQSESVVVEPVLDTFIKAVLFLTERATPVFVALFLTSTLLLVCTLKAKNIAITPGLQRYEDNEQMRAIARTTLSGRITQTNF